MNYLNTGYIILGLSIVIIFLFKRDLLIDYNSSRIILVICIILFILGYILDTLAKQEKNFVIALKIPLLCLLIFWGFLWAFKKLFNRIPVDTFWTKERNVWKDAVFNILFWIIGIIVPVLLVFKRVI
ncbi:MAG: hypothetical protein JXR57_05835 [Bacteroidales bacterium]|nr:hypothetical protein [Bacteroidales bacterium]